MAPYCSSCSSVGTAAPAASGAGTGSGGTGTSCSPVKLEHGAAGDQDLHLRRGTEEVSHDGRRAEHVLEVVQQEQHHLVAQIPLHAVEERVRPGFSDPQGGGNRRRDQRHIAEGRQVNHPDAVWEGVEQRAGSMQREAGLAHAARTGERDQAHIAAPHERDDAPEFMFAPNEGITLHRQVGAVLRPSVTYRTRSGGARLDRCARQVVHGEFSARGPDKGIPLSGQQLQHLRQQAGHLARRPALVGLDPANHGHGQANPGGEHLLGQVERFAPAAHPIAEGCRLVHASPAPHTTGPGMAQG